MIVLSPCLALCLAPSLLPGSEPTRALTLLALGCFQWRHAAKGASAEQTPCAPPTCQVPNVDPTPSLINGSHGFAKYKKGQ
ncbi:hypothetical protein BDM02DRAFT_3113422 [Thelephora ganbajun]|uniref:Uncharacterized protein n=1 Tax=Thelephora ganbajun TaxID=370292 RepID=A0ACB6ZJ78_THEGA|nr:hypothetical protein BDM02DRAFT_3113422 [Thelephora ganbajun]